MKALIMRTGLNKIAARLEKSFALLQGKGAGSFSIDDEVRLALRLMHGDELVLLDVGANKGLWTAALLKQATGRLSAAYLFEPSAHNLSLLGAIADARLTIVPAAVGAVAGRAVLYADAPGSGLASLTQRNLAHKGLRLDREEAVSVVTIDEFVSEQGLTCVDFMKIDVEGHDLDVLKGAEKSLRSGLIRALSFEMGGANVDTRTFFRDFWDLLSACGFDLGRVSPTFGLIPVPKYIERDEVFVTTNYMATRKPE